MPDPIRKEWEFVTTDVFTNRRFGGNPLAVFPDARGLSDGDMQALAREWNYSETTFVLPPADGAHTARVRIFGPAHELPFAGHPNVGTALVLAARMDAPPDVMLFEEPAGLVRVGGEGAAIAIEVWDLPSDAVGSLLALIPAPLGLGSVELMDGRRIHGFLCESYALEGALDITAHGGWRAWLAHLRAAPPGAESA